jgi:Raf kinase inhibitor-like YbhB/YbcL family protein
VRVAVLLSICLAFAGCAQPDPAPPPNETDDDDGPATQAPDESGDEDGNETSTGDGPSHADEASPAIASPAFANGEPIPTEHTADGADTSPPLNVTGTPEEAQTVALIVDDPDAPRDRPWVHWLIWNVPASTDRIPQGYPPSGDGEAFDEARQGSNSFSSDNQRYRGPAPPEGDDPHRYRFTLYALDTSLDLEPGADRSQLEAAMDGHEIAQDRLVGTYER